MGTGDLLMRLASWVYTASGPIKSSKCAQSQGRDNRDWGIYFQNTSGCCTLTVGWAGGGGIIGQQGCCQRLALTLFSSNGGKLLVLSSPFAKMTFLKPRLISVSPFNSYSCQSLAPTYSGTVLCVKLSW